MFRRLHTSTHLDGSTHETRKKELRDECDQYNLPRSGNRAELLWHLEKFSKEKESWFS